MIEVKAKDLNVGDFVLVRRNSDSLVIEGTVVSMNTNSWVALEIDGGGMTIEPLEEWTIYRTTELPTKQYALVGYPDLPNMHPAILVNGVWWVAGRVETPDQVRTLIEQYGYKILYRGVGSEDES